METNNDWQSSLLSIKERGKYIFDNGKYADCHFLIGQEPNRQIISGHKLILAMASPVFEAMFFGGLAEKNDPIPIVDVQPDAFKALLEYIYTDKININSIDKACEVCYGAKKYMLPFVVAECAKFLWSDLIPKNACRAYEFAKLFDEPLLQEKCLSIICTKTLEVITDPGFEDIELNTLLDILDQDYLNIDSELDLFFSVQRFVEKHQERNPEEVTPSTSREPSECPTVPEKNVVDDKDPKNDEPIVIVENKDDEVVIVEKSPQPSTSSAASSISSVPSTSSAQNKSTSNNNQSNYRDAIKKIRFLTLTPQQFADGPGRSNLLSQTEAFAILMNVSSPNSSYPLPDGFTSSRTMRNENKYAVPVSETPSPIVLYPAEFHANEQPTHNSEFTMDVGRDMVEMRKYYCVRTIRQQTECLNTSALDCSVTFTVDRSICITGVQVPTQMFSETNMQNNGTYVLERYSEILYAHLLDSHGARLTYTHSTPRVRYDSLMEISFDRPVFIRSNRLYKIGVVFNKVGWYPMCTCVPSVNVDNVCFTFGVGSPNESVRDGLIRAIVFTYARDGV